MADDLWKKRQFSTVEVEVDNVQKEYASSEIVAETPERQFDIINVTIAGKQLSFGGSTSAMTDQDSSGGEIDLDNNIVVLSDDAEIDEENHVVEFKGTSSIDENTHTLHL